MWLCFKINEFSSILCALLLTYIYIYNIYIYIYILKFKCIYAIMKTMCPPIYHHNGFVRTHVLGGTWYTVCTVTVHHVPKCMSCHKATGVITRRAHCFHDCIYINPILLLWDLSTLCVVDHLWPLTTFPLLSTPGAYLILKLLGAALIRGRRLFQS